MYSRGGATFLLKAVLLDKCAPSLRIADMCHMTYIFFYFTIKLLIIIIINSAEVTHLKCNIFYTQMV
jgi:hypothetical protein